MRHPLKLTREEKINIWLDLCDFSFKFLKSNLSAAKLQKRLRIIRQEHLRDDYLLLSKLADLK
jgi:hypothetical protein